MRIITYKLTVDGFYANTDIEEEVDFEFEDDATDSEIEQEVEDYWIEWRDQKCVGGFERLSVIYCWN